MGSVIPLATLLDLAASGAYGGNRNLSASTEATVRCAGVILSSLSSWQPEGLEFTESETDQIAAIVAALEYEVSRESSVEGSMQLISTQLITTPVASITWDELSGQSYVLKSSVVSSYPSDYLRLFVNGGIDETGYFKQEESWRGNIPYYNAGLNNAAYMYVANGQRAIGTTQIMLAVERILAQTKFVSISPTTPPAFNMFDASIANYRSSGGVQTSIESIIVAATGTNLLNTASTFSLYELET